MLSSNPFSFKGNSQGIGSFNNRHTKQEGRRASVFIEIVIHPAGSRGAPLITDGSFIYIVYQYFADFNSALKSVSKCSPYQQKQILYALSE